MSCARLWRRTGLAALGLLLGAIAAPVFAATPSAPAGLLVDDVANAVGTEAAPYFGWLDTDTNANEIQTGYEILVSSTQALLNANNGDLWISGEVAGSQENHVMYAGATLTADTQYFWKVRTWNREGNPSPYSTNGTFTVGLLANSDWSGASWIEGSTSAADNYTYYRKWTAALPAKTVERATAYVTSVHKYALYVDGALVGKGPAYAFPQYQFYNAWDITALVKPGTSNLFAIFNHYFGGGSGRVASLPGVLMLANIHYTDGTSTTIGTDGTWLQSQATNWATGQSQRNGEGAGYIEKIYAGSLTTNWFTTGFNASGWTNPTVIGTQPNSTWTGTLLPDLTRIVETVLPPVSVTQIGSNYVVDLGRVYSGVPLITFSGGTAGATISMAGGFRLLPSGDVSPTNDQSTTMTYYAVLNGSPFSFQPAEFLSMRFFEITNPPMPITATNFAFVERHSQMNDAASSFTSPNATLNAVWNLMKHTLPVDAQEEFIDSMRQKGGFLGDGFQESLAAMSVEDERPLTHRRLGEFIESMAEFWSTPAGNIGRVNACYPDDSNARDIPDYTQAFLEWVWEYYMQTGDLAFLGANYTSLTNVAQYNNHSLNPTNGLITRLLGGTSSSYTNGIIDWPPDMQFGYDLNTVRNPGNASTVINGWAWEDYDITSRIAGELGNTTDSNTYRGLANALSNAINTNLLNAAGLYVDGLEPNGAQSTNASQHANAFPLSLGIVPPAQQASVIAQVNSLGMSVSALGILQLVRALGEANQGPALLNLYTNANQYGWAQILALGGTATWESWTANVDGNSESHGWGAVGLDGYVRYILGVKPLTPQFGQVQIKPLDFGASLSNASGTLLTDRGQISVEWDRSAAVYHLAVTIPVNVTATVYVPQAGLTNTIVNVDGANVTGTLTNGYLGVSGLGAGAHNIQRALETLPPASLAAVPGNTQVSLNWPPSTGASSYVIQRGTSSGHETTTLASGVTSTNYTDTGLTNGDTYYYVVFASGPPGSSADSPEASATPTVGVPGSYWISTVTASAQGWNAASNWNPGTAFPNSAQSAAIINNGITANQTVILNQSVTVGSLWVGAPGGSYNVAANGGTLTFDNTPASASITQLITSRGDTISAPIINNGSLAITNLSANSFALSGNISGAANGIAVNGGVTLSGANTYSGGTAVGGGTLLVNNTSGSGTGSGPVTVGNGAGLGGAGFISGAVTIQSGGNLTPGSPLGALTFGSTLTLAGGSATIMAVSQAPLTNAAAVVLGGLTCGGALVITNLGAAPLKGGDTFTLFSAATYSGAFASVVLPPLHPALAWNTNLLNTAGTVSVAVTTQPLLKPLVVSLRGLIFSGSGGVAGAQYYLLGSSNIATPLSNWAPVLTNLFDASGNFGFTNPPVPGQGQEFYMLELP
jgi:alpha-L-rhamnosidase